MKIELIIEQLKDYFNSPKTNFENWDFYINLSEYVEFINNTPELKAEVKKLEKERDECYKKYYQLRNKSWEEIKKSGNQLLTILDANKISKIKDNELIDEIKELKGFVAGTVLYGEKKPVSIINRLLDDIAVHLANDKKGKLVEKFINSKNPSRFIFSKTLPLFCEMERDIEDNLENEKWHYWYMLKDIPDIIKLPLNKSISISNKYSNLPYEEYKYYFLFFEIKRDFKKNQGKINQYMKQDILKYKNYFQSINNYLIKQLFNQIKEQDKKYNFEFRENYLYYNERKGDKKFLDEEQHAHTLRFIIVNREKPLILYNDIKNYLHDSKIKLKLKKSFTESDNQYNINRAIVRHCDTIEKYIKKDFPELENNKIFEQIPNQGIEFLLD